MRQLVTHTFCTLDGVMQAPDAPDEDRSHGFVYGGWAAPLWDDTMTETMREWLTPPFDLLLGRKTYEVFAGYWSGDADDEDAAVMNRAHKYVVSNTLTEPAWENTEVISGHVEAAIWALKEEDGPEIQVHGSWDLVQWLLANNLVDEFRVWTFPLLLGMGKELFGNGTAPARLTLKDHRVSTTGVTIARYAVTGSVLPTVGNAAVL